MSKTTEIYLEHFDQLSEIEIARLAGVSRQRIHHLERHYRVCVLAPKRAAKRCSCGKKLRPSNKSGQCRSCRRQSMFLLLRCEICGRGFLRRRYLYQHNVTKDRYEHIFCSKKCQGRNLASKYAFGPNRKLPVIRKRKHDWELVWQKHLETGYGAVRLSRLLEIPLGTVAVILTKTKKRGGNA